MNVNINILKGAFRKCIFMYTFSYCRKEQRYLYSHTVIFVITRHGSMLVICYVITFHIFHLLISNNNIPSSNNRN